MTPPHHTVGDFIRNVEQLPDEVLRDYLTTHDPEQDPTAHFCMATAALEELLRRERERCAGVAPRRQPRD